MPQWWRSMIPGLSFSSTVRDNIASKDAAFYGMLSKLSKNFADFIERNAKAHYEASKEEITVHELRIMQQWYKSI